MARMSYAMNKTELIAGAWITWTKRHLKTTF